MPPEIEFDGPIVRGEGGRTEAPFLARDDYGVVVNGAAGAVDEQQTEALRARMKAERRQDGEGA